METVIYSGTLDSGLKWEVVPSNKKSISEENGNHYILRFVDDKIDSIEYKKELLAISLEVAENLSTNYFKGRWRIETSGPNLAKLKIFHIHIICINEDFQARRSIDPIAAR